MSQIAKGGLGGRPKVAHYIGAQMYCQVDKGFLIVLDKWE